VASRSSLFWPARWLVVPAVVAIIAMMGAAISAAPRPDFGGPESDLDQGPKPGSDFASDFASDIDPDFNPGDRGRDPGGNVPGDFDFEPDHQPPPNASVEGEQVPDRVGGEGNGGNLSTDGDRDGDDDRAAFTVTTDDYSVTVVVGDGDLQLQPRQSGGERGDTLVFEPGANDGQAWQIADNGQFEPVDVDDIGDGTPAFRPLGEGLEIINADGSRIQVILDEDGDFTVSEIDPSGQSTVHTPDSDGNVTIDDVTVGVPIRSVGVWERVKTTPWTWIVIGMAMLALASIAAAIYLQVIRPRRNPGTDPDLGRQVLPAEVDDLLAELRADPDPARAIRLAFAAAERGMGSLPPRRRTETPFEWCSRAGGDAPELFEPLTSLASHFATARFAPDRPSAADRDAAVDELDRLAELTGFAPRRPSSAGAVGVTA